MVKIKTLVTSALPYIHGLPHLGNMVGSILPADVYFKYLKLKGEEAIFICGSDEHGAQMELEALRQGEDPEKLSTKNHEFIKKTLLEFGCNFTYYGRTHCEGNKKSTYEIFDGLLKNGYIVEKECIFPYCKNCEKFLPDRFVEGVCPYCGGLGRGDQCDSCSALLDPTLLIEAYCNVCKKKEIEFRKTWHLFLDLPKLQKKLKKWVGENEHWPTNAKKIALDLLKRGLEQRCITRDLKWGFSVPLKGYENKVFYVWLDAPTAYIGITREWSEKIGKPNEWERWWKDETKIIHFLGKDNIPFHTIFWPAFLIGSNLGYTLPYQIQSYEFLVAGSGIKFSKSRGVGLNAQTALEILPADYWRYSLIMLIPETSDSEFSWVALQSFVNGDLNDTLGNFIHRTLVFIKKYFEGTIPKPGKNEEEEKKLIEECEKQIREYVRSFDEIKLRDVLRAAVSVAREGNVYLSKKEPWILIKRDKEQAGACLYICANLVKKLAILLYPFLPNTSKLVWEQLGLDNFDKISFFDLDKELKEGHKIGGNIRPIFEKITEEKLEEFKRKFESS